MNIILLGPSGSGKGVQAKLLIEKFGFKYVVISSLLKESWSTRPEVKAMMETGVLVPDKTTFEVLQDSFRDQKPENVIFDGYPRTITQYQLFKDWLTKMGAIIDLAIVLKVSDGELVKRLSARRIDPATGKIYNLITDRPPANIDSGLLVQRDDDKPETVKKRLGWYHESVEPLIEKLKEDMEVIEVDGQRSIDTIHKDLAGLIERKLNARG